MTKEMSVSFMHCSCSQLFFPLSSIYTTKSINGGPTKCDINSTNYEPSQEKKKIEIRVCTNRTCRRQGSFQTLEVLSGLAPSHVSVKPCGCLGRCGSGPNLVCLPDPVIVGHCGTPTRAAELMVGVCGGGGPEIARKSLDALALRKKAEIELERGTLSEAEVLFSQVIEAKPIGGIHIAYKGRSAVRLASGKFSGALEDAKDALLLAPEYAEAHISKGDAFLAMDQLEAAGESYAMALECDPSIRRLKSFKVRIEKLQEKMASIAIP